MNTDKIVELITDNINRTESLYIITSVTRQCVLNCRYCYAINPDFEKKEILSSDILEKIIRDAFTSGKKEIKFEWTGGEAFLAGLSFFKQVVELQKKWSKKQIKYSNCIQTSGAILNRELINFLVANDFHIGLTIDGTQDAHNNQRPTANGKKSYETVIKTFNYIKEKQGDCGTLCTITKSNFGSYNDIIESFSNIGVSGWHSNFYIYDSNKPKKDQKLAITSDDFYKYLKGQADYFLDDPLAGPPPKTLKMFLHKLSGLQFNNICTYSGNCIGSFINIDHKGNATLCSKFIGSDKYRFGNIKNDSIKDLISPSNLIIRKIIYQRANAMKKCLDDKCDYFNLCKSGCPYLATLNASNNDMTGRDSLCEGKRKIFMYLEHKLEKYGIKSYSSQVIRNY